MCLHGIFCEVAPGNPRKMAFLVLFSVIGEVYWNVRSHKQRHYFTKETEEKGRWIMTHMEQAGSDGHKDAVGMLRFNSGQRSCGSWPFRSSGSAVKRPKLSLKIHWYPFGKFGIRSVNIFINAHFTVETLGVGRFTFIAFPPVVQTKNCNDLTSPL